MIAYDDMRNKKRLRNIFSDTTTTRHRKDITRSRKQ